MKIKILILFFCIAYFISFTTEGQSKKAQSVRWPAKKADVQAVKERTLLVALPGINSADERLKKMFTKFWDFSKTEFVSAQAIPSIIKGKESQYAIMSVNIVEIKQAGVIIGKISSSYIRFSVRLAEKYDKKKSIYYQDVFFTTHDNNINLADREIFVGIRNIINHYNSRLNDEGIIEAPLKNAGKLEKRTLLIDKEFLHEKMTSEKIGKLYPYSFKIVDSKEIETAIMDKNASYAFVELVPAGSSTNIFTHDIYDCSDGQMLSTGELNNGAFDIYSNFVNDDHLKAYVRNYERINEMAAKRK
ncbi:MAG: hypothetical protein ACNS60_07340 [Candidatus Cyclobacteriaceae bacterium M2_1C_046]